MFDYFLHVELIVRKSDDEAFRTNVAQFLNTDGGFARLVPGFKSTLVLALRTLRPFDYDGFERYQSDAVEPRDKWWDYPRRNPGGDTAKTATAVSAPAKEPAYRYIHLWRVPDLADLDLVRVMKLCADDALYIAVDKLVAREVQDFVARVRWAGGLPDPTDARRYVRVVRQFRSEDVGTYLFQSGALLPVLEAKGWHSLGAFQTVTGLLNTVIEFWQPRDGDHTAQSMTQSLKTVESTLQRSLVSSYESLAVADVRDSFVAYLERSTNGTWTKRVVST